MGLGKKIAGGFLVLLGAIELVYGVPYNLGYVATYGLTPTDIGGLTGAVVLGALMLYFGIKLIRSKK